MRLALEKGQTFTWEWKVSGSRESAGQPKKSGESTTPVMLRVLDRTNDGYLLEIQNGGTLGDPTAQRPTKSNPELLALQRFIETLKVQFLVTGDGEIKDIVNLDEIKASSRKVAEVESQNGRYDREVLLLMFERFVGSSESIKDLILKDVGLMFYGTHVDPQMKKSVDLVTELQDLFGSGPIKLAGQLSLTGLDRKNKVAQIHVEQEADKQAFIQAVKKGYARAAGQDPPKDMLEAIMQNGSMRDVIDATVGLDSALATHLKRVRSFVEGETVRIEQVELTLRN